jgi:hypothetical protein
MPQRDAKLGSTAARRQLGVPERAGYARKREVDRSGPVKAPKSAFALSTMNANYRASLGRMTRNVEMIAAGKLVNEGRILRCVVCCRPGGC